MNHSISHSDLVYSTARNAKASLSSPVAASWRRCLKFHRLQPDNKMLPLRLARQEFDAALKRSGPVLNAASSEIERLSHLVGKAGCCVLLSDADGLVIGRRGTGEDDQAYRDAGLWTGVMWSEQYAGTNGIGTTLVEERPVTIYRHQHFFTCKSSISCTAAPIRDQHGKVTAAIAISTYRSDINEVTMTIFSQVVRDAARIIETALFRGAFETLRVILLSHDSRGGPALLAVDRDDLVVGATRAARLALGLDDRRIALGVAASDLLNEQLNIRGGCDLIDAERAALRRVLARTAGNISRAAAQLGISRTTLYRKMRRLSLG